MIGLGMVAVILVKVPRYDPARGGIVSDAG